LPGRSRMAAQTIILRPARLRGPIRGFRKRNMSTGPCRASPSPIPPHTKGPLRASQTSATCTPGGAARACGPSSCPASTLEPGRVEFSWLPSRFGPSGAGQDTLVRPAEPPCLPQTRGFLVGGAPLGRPPPPPAGNGARTLALFRRKDFVYHGLGVRRKTLTMGRRGGPGGDQALLARPHDVAGC